MNTEITKSLSEFGGHLECTICGRQEKLNFNGDTPHYLSYGWPKCHNLTMTWITARQLVSDGSTND